MTSKAFGLAQLGNAFADGALSSRNKIINGAMVVDQRNAGAAVTASAAGTYFGADRTLFFKNSSANFTIQQSSVAPAGFNKSLSATVTSAASSTAAQNVVFQQNVEGFNAADFNWGSANASTVTLSFWVRSSLTGIYCVAFRNAAFNRSYVAEYTINIADTWEQKTITISGDTTGTWEIGNLAGIRVAWDLGSGTDSNGTAGSWSASAATRTTNQADFANTSSATFYITGVQLEAGDTATPFEQRPYGQELALCQRYFQRITASGRFNSASGGSWGLSYPFKVTMRANPTYTDGPALGTSSLPATNQGIISGSTQDAGIQWVGTANTDYFAYAREASFSAEL